MESSLNELESKDISHLSSPFPLCPPSSFLHRTSKNLEAHRKKNFATLLRRFLFSVFCFKSNQLFSLPFFCNILFSGTKLLKVNWNLHEFILVGFSSTFFWVCVFVSRLPHFWRESCFKVSLLFVTFFFYIQFSFCLFFMEGKNLGGRSSQIVQVQTPWMRVVDICWWESDEGLQRDDGKFPIPLPSISTWTLRLKKDLDSPNFGEEVFRRLDLRQMSRFSNFRGEIKRSVKYHLVFCYLDYDLWKLS